MSLASLIPTGGEFCVLRTQVVDSLLACCDGDSALLYLYLVRQGQSFDERAAMRTLNMTRDRYDRAVHTLTNLHLVTTPAETQKYTKSSSAPPRYTAAEMRARREGDHRFASVCQTAEIVLGRTLTEGQLRTLMNAYAHLGLPADVLIDLLTYLKREKGTVTRRDIEEQAYLWADMGIFTAEAAGEFLSRREAEKPLLSDMLRALDMAGREPAPDEYRYLSGFIRQGFDAEAVSLAKERMYTRLGKFSWKYLAGIMESWHNKGLHTAAEITAVEPNLRQTKPSATSAPSANRKPPEREDGNLADWERDWLEEFHAMTRKEETGNGI
ncbi:MAG: DnaD domain protein [Eubacteriales bacterium]|nr:DnaD domain protein [Eubacteriales bacterium]